MKIRSDNWIQPALKQSNRFKLFEWWIEKHGHNLPLAALAMGVSRSTAQRWYRQRDIPASVAMLLEQIKNGPVFSGGVFRGLSFVRTSWRPYVAAHLTGSQVQQSFEFDEVREIRELWGNASSSWARWR